MPRSLLLLICLALVLPAACQPAPPAGKAPDYLAVAADLSNRLQAAAAMVMPADVRDSNLPLVALEIDKLQERPRYAIAAFDPAQDASVKAAEAALARCKAGEVAYRGLTGGENAQGYLERAYQCRTDGSAQPYFVRLPADYDPAKRYPLVLFLHGYVPETSKIYPWVLPPQQWKMAADRQMILVLPHGRRNTDFLGIGEVDVLRVIEEMQRFYSIDPDRIHMTGSSMGGYGGWALALRHPDMFAALSPMAGQSDFFLWEKRQREQTAYKTWCISQNNPLDLVGNARWLPTFVQHGALDTLVPTEHSRLIVPELRRRGYQVEYKEYEGQGHYIYWEDPPFEAMFDFVKPKVRAAAPPHITFRTFTPKQGQAYWIDVRALAQWGPPADIEADLTAGKLALTCTNVAELYLDPPAKLRGDRPVAVTVNGKPAGPLGAGSQRLTIAADGTPALAAATPPAERPLVGPAREVFNSPFLAVVATGGDDARQALNMSRARAFQGVWLTFAEAFPPMVLDTTLTEDLVKGRNLVIFGEPSTVKLPGIADPAKMLPAGIAMEPGKYTVGTHTYSGDKVGMVLLTPHPVRPQGLVLWNSGVEYGRGLPANHKFDLLPDLLVYEDRVDWDGTSAYLAGGFLGPNWRLDEKRLDLAEQTLR
ncbi:MAG: prolyl oligopeptidase family serine peptidase [Armatimonadetes bacterium]|nr:prolyl oligopeptidase family serine peptidase [Armatimonadota bacterium]